MFITAIVFIVLTTLLGNLLWKVMNEEIDHHVQVITTQAKQVVEGHDENERVELFKQLVTAQGMTVMLMNPQGVVLTQVNTLNRSQVPVEKLLSLKERTLTASSQPYHLTLNGLRLATVPVKLASGDGLVVVGYSLDVLQEAFRNLILLVVIVMSVAFLIMIVGGSMLLQKYLEPLETVTDTAQTVSDSEDKRVVVYSVPEPTYDIMTRLKAKLFLALQS